MGVFSQRKNVPYIKEKRRVSLAGSPTSTQIVNSYEFDKKLYTRSLKIRIISNPEQGKEGRKMASESEAKPESTMEETPDTLPKSPAVITSVPEVIPSVPAVITSVPAGVQKAFSSHLSPKQTELMLDLCSIECGQLHLFEKWDQSKPDKVSPAVLRQMANQIESLDESYPGGLREYIKTAQKLLAGTSRHVEAEVSN